jgi:glycosyltransferase involved in cell wall biosynthesis
VVARRRAEDPQLRLVVAGGLDARFDLEGLARAAGIGEGLVVTGRLALADFVRHLCAADVVLALRFPSHGEMSGALVRALGVGRPVLVSAGTAAAEEFPEGVVVRVDPGPAEEAELEALLRRLMEDAPLRDAIGGLAREHVRPHHDLEETTRRLATFLEEVAATREAVLAQRAAEGTDAGGLFGFLLEEVRWGARDLGLADLRLGLESLIQPLVPEGR